MGVGAANPLRWLWIFQKSRWFNRLFYSQFSLQFTGERLHLGAENRILSNKVSIVHDK